MMEQGTLTRADNPPEERALDARHARCRVLSVKGPTALGRERADGETAL
jgi:hypothetical protein